MPQPEQILQIDAITWFKAKHYQFRDDIYHFANERKCSIQQGVLLKRMGVMAGVWDIFIGIGRKGKSGLWVELKWNKNKPSPAQLNFGERQLKNNFAGAICWTLNGFIEVVEDYFANDNIVNIFDEIIYKKSA